jgi:hypothetical protein
MTITPIGLYIPASEVFPQLQSDFETFKTLLESLSLTDTLFWCARLNLIVSDPIEQDHVVKQEFGIKQFLTREEVEAVNEFVRRQGDIRKVTIFFRGQILELLRWVARYCEDQPGDGETFENEEVRRNFAKAALIASDIWAKRVFGNRFSLGGGVETARQRALGSIRKSMEATQTASDLAKTLGRGWAFFSEYFPRNYEAFEGEFEAATGISVKDYYICLCGIITSFMNPKNNSGIFDSTKLGNATPYAEVLARYLTLESQSIDAIRDSLWSQGEKDINDFDGAPPYDYRPLREKPIIRAKDGRAIIIDPVFYSEKASVGPLFHLLSETCSREKANKVFGAFGNAFEKYSCDILRRMFPDTGDVFCKRLECNLRIMTDSLSQSEIEIDACLDDVVEIVIFEMKAVWLREDEILVDEYEHFLEHLRKKYGVTCGGDRDRKVKGVGQLARIISVLASEQFPNYNDKLSEAQLVYPVLVVHDPFLGAPVYGHFLSSEFKLSLDPDVEYASGETIKGRFRVAPLIIMTVEDLEILETSIEHFSLRDLFQDYSIDCSDRLTSLHNFIVFSNYGKKIFHSRSVASKALEILKEAQEAVFPRMKSLLNEKQK